MEYGTRASMYQIYPEAQRSRLCIRASLPTIPMRVRDYLAAIEGHHWELGGVEHAYQI